MNDQPVPVGTTIHLYPFPPWGEHGGTLRLRTATMALGGEVRWWDSQANHWVVLDSIDLVCAPQPKSSARRPGSSGRAPGLKRRLFPSTLWESGRAAVAGARDMAHREPSTFVLHTTYLAPLAVKLREAGHRVVVDAYDLIWRAHSMDVEGANAIPAATRRAYARTVRTREIAALRHADVVLVAGWTDFRSLNRQVANASWVPTGLEVALSSRERSDRLSVGLIGNFAHSATSDSARRLLDSPIATDPAFELVFAGHGSEAWTQGRHRSLGRVDHVGEFYDEVDATVVPVGNGAGMKCKLAESALAGKTTVTTPHGAAGFPESLSDHLVVVANEAKITSTVVRAAIRDSDPERLRAAFSERLSLPNATAAYRAAVEAHGTIVGSGR